MTEDMFLIDIPVFEPKYEKDKQYGYTKYRENLWELLVNITGGYCMYCYDTVVINRQKRGQIEHAIEKFNSEEKLMDCVPNLGLACANCNTKYKRRGETKRQLSEETINNFGTDNCQKFECKGACQNFNKIRKEYIQNGKILIQPFKIYGEDQRELKMQYNLLSGKYIPSKKEKDYKPEELEIIEGHIKQFCLNKPDRKNYEIGKYCRNVTNNKALMENVEYNNLLVDLLRDKLKKIELEKAIKLCEVIYENLIVKQST